MSNPVSRPLTPGEVALCRTVFGEAIDYDAVRIHCRRWWPLQPRRVVMAPDGHIWCHPEGGLWHEDFAREPLGLRGLFVHEMTHVWQAQRGGRWYLPLARHPFCRYAYRFDPGRPFARYGIEQQAELVRHAFLLGQGATLPEAPALADLYSVLPFTSSPRA